ncbi:hemocyte protein-glutamine gamma-glutamyltransferase-like [Diprion similis]|uniref:hemocyte protein-glutamine gamma-glutamyltransferase-like n=1 Tax=Diprion similis TaxID=362088 RepID=UPI001EF96A97|nr:hemocyte protein-glutamine gamma-glutamyltransferase-like [Diprion similis]
MIEEKSFACLSLLISIWKNWSKTNQTWVGEDDFRVVKPSIVMEIPRILFVGRPKRILLYFENPLKKSLTDCKMNFGGSRFVRAEEMSIGPVAPGEKVQVTYDLIPQTSGKHNILVTFTSKQLSNITGMATVEVTRDWRRFR